MRFWTVCKIDEERLKLGVRYGALRNLDSKMRMSMKLFQDGPEHKLLKHANNDISAMPTGINHLSSILKIHLFDFFYIFLLIFG